MQGQGLAPGQIQARLQETWYPTIPSVDVPAEMVCRIRSFQRPHEHERERAESEPLCCWSNSLAVHWLACWMSTTYYVVVPTATLRSK
jgi:hypothetical protein